MTSSDHVTCLPPSCFSGLGADEWGVEDIELDGENFSAWDNFTPSPPLESELYYGAARVGVTVAVLVFIILATVVGGCALLLRYL